MSVRLNHTIVWCHDQEKSATFLTEILGLPPPRRFMGFLVVDLANDVSVDYLPAESEPVALQHLAFLVSEEMGAFAGLAMGLTALATAVLAPWLGPMLISALG